jgi:hypothetical protein
MMEEPTRMLKSSELGRFMVLVALASACGKTDGSGITGDARAPADAGALHTAPHDTGTGAHSGAADSGTPRVDAGHDGGRDAAHDARPTRDASNEDSRTPMKWVCPPLPDGGYPGGAPDESSGSGSLLGPEVSCSVCDVGTELFEVTVPDGFPGTTYSLALGNAAHGEASCTLPAGASHPFFSGGLMVPGTMPGTYGSGTDASTGCSNLAFTYQLPDGGSASYGVGDPCAVGAPTVGSWTLTLTSVEYVDGGVVGFETVGYTVHGSLTATLVNAPDGGTGPSATLQLTF